jgi:hypothetical protein
LAGDRQAALAGAQLDIVARHLGDQGQGDVAPVGNRGAERVLGRRHRAPPKISSFHAASKPTR